MSHVNAVGTRIGATFSVQALRALAGSPLGGLCHTGDYATAMAAIRTSNALLCVDAVASV